VKKKKQQGDLNRSSQITTNHKKEKKEKPIVGYPSNLSG